MDLSNKTIVLTGASSGIGLDLLKKLSKFDCKIMAVARTINNIEFDAPNIIKYPCDISIPENIDQLFDDALKKLGRIDIFIANAGYAYYEEIKTPDWDHIEKIYKTNVFSSIYCAEKMKQINLENDYRMVITASAMSFMPIAGYALYASTKAALHGFAMAYRHELKKGQKLQMIYPIGTKTNFFKEAGPSTPVAWPTQRSRDVAKAIVKGLQKDTEAIFPSKLFLTLKTLDGYVPLVSRFISEFEGYKFDRWSKNRFR